jgi:hypothetical protein
LGHYIANWINPRRVKLGISSDKKSIAAKLKAHARPSAAQQRYLRLGMTQPGRKLPLFDDDGQRIPVRTIRACLDAGWCEPWHTNPIEPKWLVCKLTSDGELALGDMARK